MTNEYFGIVFCFLKFVSYCSSWDLFFIEIDLLILCVKGRYYMKTVKLNKYAFRMWII